MTLQAWWMRIVGALYLLQSVMMVFVRAPISAQGPPGALAQAAAGEPIASFLVDTWVIFGLEVGAVGAALLLFSFKPEQARALLWAVIGIELARGIVADVYLLSRGGVLMPIVIWIPIHTIIIVTGLLVLRGTRSRVAA